MRRENRLARTVERLRARRRSDLVHVLLGAVFGAASGAGNALLHPAPIGYLAVLLDYIAGLLIAARLARRVGEYSFGRGLVSYSSMFTLWWFSLYASLIQ